MLVIRSSISKYKKFFQKKLEKFKSLFCLGYQKLPKTVVLLQNHSSSYYVAPAAAVDNNYKDLEKLYNDFTEQWDSEKGNKRRKSKKRIVVSSSHSPVPKQEKIETERLISKKQSENKKDCVVEKKLRELEMLDKSDVDYILDIEEVLHYYSRLTCPAYLEIVDKFVFEIYSEFFGSIN